MTSTQIAPITDADLPDLARLREHWTSGEPADPDADFVAAVRQWWASENRVGWLARVDGYALGMANAAVFARMPVPGRPPARWSYVANVWVDPHHRRQGIGRALMGAAIDWARSEEMVRIVLAPSEMSIPLYASLGLRPATDLMRLDL